MGENTATYQKKVGLFLALGLVGLIFSIFFLGGEKRLFTKYVTLYGKMPHVQGLNRGSLISLAGIPVGNIREITFAEDGAVVIAMKIEASHLPNIKEGSTIETRTQGALGDKFVYINPGPFEGAPLKDGDTIQVSKQLDLMGVLSERGGEAAKIFEALNETLVLLRSVNAGNRIEQILGNLNSASVNFKDMSAEGKLLLADLRSKDQGVTQAVRHMNSIMAKVDRGEGTLGALVNDSTVHDQIKKILGGGERKRYLRGILQNSIEEK